MRSIKTGKDIFDFIYLLISFNLVQKPQLNFPIVIFYLFWVISYTRHSKDGFWWRYLSNSLDSYWFFIDWGVWSTLFPFVNCSFNFTLFTFYKPCVYSWTNRPLNTCPSYKNITGHLQYAFGALRSCHVEVKQEICFLRLIIMWKILYNGLLICCWHHMILH